jgi:hypothetical protein
LNSALPALAINHWDLFKILLSTSSPDFSKHVRPEECVKT